MVENADWTTNREICNKLRFTVSSEEAAKSTYWCEGEVVGEDGNLYDLGHDSNLSCDNFYWGKYKEYSDVVFITDDTDKDCAKAIIGDEENGYEVITVSFNTEDKDEYGVARLGQATRGSITKRVDGAITVTGNNILIKTAMDIANTPETTDTAQTSDNAAASAQNIVEADENLKNAIDSIVEGYTGELSTDLLNGNAEDFMGDILEALQNAGYTEDDLQDVYEYLANSSEIDDNSKFYFYLLSNEEYLGGSQDGVLTSDEIANFYQTRFGVGVGFDGDSGELDEDAINSWASANGADESRIEQMKSFYEAFCDTDDAKELKDKYGETTAVTSEYDINTFLNNMILSDSIAAFSATNSNSDASENSTIKIAGVEYDVVEGSYCLVQYDSDTGNYVIKLSTGESISANMDQITSFLINNGLALNCRQKL